MMKLILSLIHRENESEMQLYHTTQETVHFPENIDIDTVMLEFFSMIKQ